MADVAGVSEPAEPVESFEPDDVSDVRVRRRVEPRFGVAIAGAGIVIAVGGALGLAGDQTGGADDPNRLPGIIVSLALVAAGVALVRRFRTGALALAGSVAALAGVPAFLAFATIDEESLLPFDLAPTLLIAAIGWGVLHVVCDGRLLFLSAALVALPLFVMETTEHVSDIPEVIGYAFVGGFAYDEDDFDSGTSFVPAYEDLDGDGFDDVTLLSEEEFEEAYAGFEDFSDDFSDDDFDVPAPPEPPDPTVLGAIAIVFAVLYVGVGQRLSERGAFGVATPPTVIGALLAALGVALLASDLREVVTGLVLIGIGASLAWFGVAAGRRFTTWFGSLLLGIGVVVLIERALGDSPDASGASLVALVIGSAVVVAGHVVGQQLDEAPEEGQRALPVAALPGEEPPPFEVPLEGEE